MNFTDQVAVIKFEFDVHTKFPVNHVQSISQAIAENVSMVTFPLHELASKYTFLPLGTLAQEAPQEVSDQFVVLDQFPFPHVTQ